jgi:hypothetical protein
MIWNNAQYLFNKALEYPSSFFNQSYMLYNSETDNLTESDPTCSIKFKQFIVSIASAIPFLSKTNIVQRFDKEISQAQDAEIHILSRSGVTDPQFKGYINVDELSNIRLFLDHTNNADLISHDTQDASRHIIPQPTFSPEEFYKKLKNGFFKDIDPNINIVVNDSISKDFNFNNFDFPKNKIIVHGDFTIYDNHTITDLNINIQAENIIIMNCAKLNSMSGEIEAKELVTLEQLSNLQKISASITSTEQNLSFKSCRKLTDLNDAHIEVMELILDDSKINFPAHTVVKDSLILRNNSYTIYTPNQIRIFIKDCTLDKQIIAQFNNCKSVGIFHSRVTETIIIDYNLKNLTIVNTDIELEDDMQISGNFYIKNNRFATIPQKFKVSGDRCHFQTPAIRDIPNDFQFQNKLILTDCYNITSLPEDWLRRLTTSDDIRRTISIEGLSSISDAQIAHYNTNYNNLTVERPAPVRSFSTLKESIDKWIIASTNKDLKISLASLDETDQATVKSFLEKLTTSVNFINIKLKENFANKVVNMLQLLENAEEEIKAEIITVCTNGLGTCQDRAVLSLTGFDLLLMRINAEKASINNREGIEFKKYLKTKLIYEVIEQYGVSHARKNGSIEEVEFVLAYMVALAPLFDLPFKIEQANYTEMAGITPEDIQQLCNKVNEITDTYVETQLKHEAFWQKHQRRFASEWKSYAELPVVDSSVSYNDEDIEMISRESVKDIPDLVFYNNHFYSYESLYQWFIERGTDPLSPDTLIDINNVYAVKK